MHIDPSAKRNQFNFERTGTLVLLTILKSVRKQKRIAQSLNLLHVGPNLYVIRFVQVPSLIKISKVSFKKIRGTSASQVAVKVLCSQSVPCQEVEIADIDLVYNGPEGPATSECANVKPVLSGKLNPAACAKVVS